MEKATATTTASKSGEQPQRSRQRGRGGRGGRGRGKGSTTPNETQVDIAKCNIPPDNVDATKGKKQQQHHGNNRGQKKQQKPNRDGEGQQDSNNNIKKRNDQNNRKGRGKQKVSSNNAKFDSKYPSHWSYEKCMRLYIVEKDPTLVRGKLRALPSKDGMAFCACDRGSLKRDVLLGSSLERNRGLNGDIVFVELLPPTEHEEDGEQGEHLVKEDGSNVHQGMAALGIGIDEEHKEEKDRKEEDREMWQDDQAQMKLWNPAVPVRRIKKLAQVTDEDRERQSVPQRKGRVVHVCAPPIPSDAPKGTLARRVMVGSLRALPSGTCLFTPNDRMLPQFKCETNLLKDQRGGDTTKGQTKDSSDLYKAEYIYHSWKEMHSWPPCINAKRLGDACSIEDQIQGLLMENQVDHGEFSPAVLKNVEDAVQSGVYLMTSSTQDGIKADDGKDAELGWKPTPEMLKGRRDYRKERIFTIDPTTAKDLDDALHIKKLPGGRIEIGVHIADVSAFVTPGSDVDKEALRRATTVYLVDRTIPMLPRPLCEVACSLNEAVERLAFSCVWNMSENGETPTDVWYGRTVIKSCARLDYSTAQNIIDNKVAAGEAAETMPDEFWPKSRRPTGGHTIDEVAADVRLMHRVAMARRRQRFSNGALALHGVKLTFQLDDDGETPLRCAPYPIKDSNRLVEEYMLLANYLVAQRLITHAGDRAVLRHHPDPLPEGLEKVVHVAKAMFDFDVDASSSASLQASLVRFEGLCNDEIVQKCMTQMLTTPMQTADYFAAGSFEKELWRHFALNIPYYTHFTSPIRRYADVLVHRLLQATLDGQEAVDKFPLDAVSLNDRCVHCNEKRLASKTAQERCDIVFLALFLRKNPMKSELGIVMSLGIKAITVFVPKLGISTMLFLEEHRDWLDYTSHGEEHERRLVLTRKGGQQAGGTGRWNRLDVRMFTKLSVSCLYKDKPQVDVKLQLEGPGSSSNY